MIERDERLIELLRLTGPRPPVPLERLSRVRDRVHQEWRRQIDRRRRQRVIVTAAVGAAAAIALLAVRLNAPTRVQTDTRPTVATTTSPTAAPVPLVAGATLTATHVLSLRLADRSEVRVAAGASLRMPTAEEIELLAGAIYVDVDPASKGLVVRTRYGDVHDIGTRFEVRILDDRLRVRVRNGRVELRRGSDAQTADAGYALTAARDGRLRSERIRTSGDDWAWISALAPRFAIEGRTLDEDLSHLSREQGWIVRFDEPSLADRARRARLHGSVDGLSARDALAVTLRTSGLAHRFEGDTLTIRSAGE